jgi:hypothetical protein
VNPQKKPGKKKSGLADSPFFAKGESEIKEEKRPVSEPADPILAKEALELPESPNTGETESGSPDVRQSRSPVPPESRSPVIPEIRGYEVRRYDQMRRMDIRFTGKQKRYLDDLFEDIKQVIPEGDRSDPEYGQITRSSIIRALVEIARQLEITVDASDFRNEGDLLRSLFEVLHCRVAESRSPEIPDTGYPGFTENQNTELRD